MAVGYTALLLDLETQRTLRDVYGVNHPAVAVTTPRIIDAFGVTREDQRSVAPESVRIVGLHETGEVRALLIEVDGAIRRADGGFYNIALHAPERGLHIKTIDEVVQTMLSAVPPVALRNREAGEVLNVRPGFVVGVERPKAIVAARPAVAAPASKFLRQG